MSKKNVNEISNGVVILVVEWRQIPYSPKFEMNPDGVIRNVKTKALRASKGPIQQVDGEGKRRNIPIWKVHEELWPELN